MLRCLVIATAVLLLAGPAGAGAADSTGGAAAPDGSGGTTVGQPSSVAAAPKLSLRIAPAAPTTGATLTFTVPAPTGASASSVGRRVKARIDLVPLGTRRAVARVRFTVAGTRASRVRWTASTLPAGTYGARLTLSRLGVVARTRLTVVAPAPKPVATPTPTPTPAATPAPAAPTGRQLTSLSPGVFPVQGPYTFGGDGSRFGAGRTGHIHQGQDVAAASGTPIVEDKYVKTRVDIFVDGFEF